MAVGKDLAILEQPNRKQLQLEVASKSRTHLENLGKKFGGRMEKLPDNWLKCSLNKETKPIQVGGKRLIIPAGAAFGTGEHATTAMSLRLLEKLSRSCSDHWSMLDLGTGSGILALAAKLLGATPVIAIDNDPVAISSAKQNARLNRVRGIQFRIADVRKWKSSKSLDVLTANLYSELLIEILPKLKTARSLILSGFLRTQERDVRRALALKNIDVVEARRRGKWVAVLARCR